MGGFTDTVKVGKAFPNQGIKLSQKNSLAAFLVTLSICGLIGLGLIFGLIGVLSGAPDVDVDDADLRADRFGLIFGLIVGLNRGGSAVIKHYALRLTLWLNRYTPLNFISFLETCDKLILLKKVGVATSLSTGCSLNTSPS